MPVVFLPQTHNPSLKMRKTTDKLQGRILQNTWLVLFQNVKVIKNIQKLSEKSKPDSKDT